MYERRQYLYQEIAEAMRRRIAAGEFARGDRLPAVRTLAQDWSCTPGTVSRAYGILSDEGLVVGQRGKGTRVAANVLQPGTRWTGQADDPNLRWATLVNRAEQFVLEAAGSGFAASEAQAALTVAISRWRAMRDAAGSALAHIDGATMADAASEDVLRFAGSHDLLVENIAGLMRSENRPLEMQLIFNGSLGGLMALLRGEADVAGIHLWDEETDSYNEPFVKRLFPGGRAKMVTLAQRSLGLIVDAQVASEVRSLAEMVRRKMRFVNRQQGSGTRLWLDAQLRALDIDGAEIEGYGTEVATHMAVAQRVAAGQADVGLGIYAAAAALGLGFVPLTQERYDLVFLQAIGDRAPVSTLVDFLNSKSLRGAIEAFGGYDSTETGRIWPRQETET